jgi:predicted nuclease of predicted toxin-antitoxin system
MRQLVAGQQQVYPNARQQFHECGMIPEFLHIREVGLKAAPEPVVWVYAAKAGYVIVSKDADFRQRSFL